MGKRRRVNSSPAPVIWATLPLDVLAMIFEYATFRGRLCVISFVCKQWRRAVLRSVTSYKNDGSTLDAYDQLPRIISLFPGLTELDIDSGLLMPMALPMGLTKLSCHVIGGFPLPSPFPALRSISVSVHRFSPMFIPMLATCWSSLTSLVLSSNQPLESFFLSRGLSFPLLSALALTFDKLDHEGIWDLLARHATQLTSLSVNITNEHTANIHSNIARLSFPRLRLLCLKGVSDAALSKLLPIMPPHCELQLYNVDPSAMAPQYLPALVSIRFLSKALDTALFERCTRLTCIAPLWQHWTYKNLAERTLAARLRELQLGTHYSNGIPHGAWRQLCLFSNLCKVTLDARFATSAKPLLAALKPLSFPYLTELSLKSPGRGWVDTLQVLGTVITAAPRLRRVSADLPFLERPSRDLVALQELLHTAEEAGVEEMDVDLHNPDQKVDTDAIQAQFKWMKVVLRMAE